MSPLNLQQWLEILESRHPTEIELGLERIRQVALCMQLPKPAQRVVTVTGTNGKGSTCAFLDSLCRAQGLSTAVYSSPHFLRYAERVRINGQLVADSLLCEAFAAIEVARGDISLTYFETGTLAALWLFARQPLDLVILEVGLGGRLDAVNIIDPDLAAVTSVALDHADWLGSDREQVGYEKAGIFRAQIPALCGDLDPPVSLLQQAAQLGAPLVLRGRDFDLAVDSERQQWHWRGQDSQGREQVLNALPMPALPVENAALALQLYALLDLPLDAQSCGQALAQTRMTGRLQQIDHQGRRLILDVAHNPQAAQYLAAWLEQRPFNGRRHAVFAALSDKDVQGVVQGLAGCCDSWAVAALPTPRSLSGVQLQQMLQQAGEQATVHDSIGAAFAYQLAQSQPGDELLVFGSFFTVAAVLESLGLDA